MATTTDVIRNALRVIQESERRAVRATGVAETILETSPQVAAQKLYHAALEHKLSGLLQLQLDVVDMLEREEFRSDELEVIELETRLALSYDAELALAREFQCLEGFLAAYDTRQTILVPVM